MQAAVVLELGPQSGLIGDAEQYHGESGKLFPQAQLWRGQVVSPLVVHGQVQALLFLFRTWRVIRSRHQSASTRLLARKPGSATNRIDCLRKTYDSNFGCNHASQVLFTLLTGI